MPTSQARLANLLGAAATGLADAVDDPAAAGPRLDAKAATALVALLDFTPSGTVRMLSQVIGLTHSGAVRLADRLAAAGYVARGPGADSRSVTVTLTGPGRQAARRIRAHRERVITAALDGLAGPQRAELTAACELIIANLANQRLAQRVAGTRPAGGALCRMCDFTACGRPAGRCPAAAAAAGWPPGPPAR